MYGLKPVPFNTANFRGGNFQGRSLHSVRHATPRTKTCPWGPGSADSGRDDTFVVS
jgi:hypothetical protein